MENKFESGQYLTFTIDDEKYAIAVFSIKEIIEIPDITPVPGMTDIVRGIVNIRGAVIPVIDLKLKFINKRTELTRNSVIIVVEVEKIENETAEIVLMGIIADSAKSVININADDFERPPQVGKNSSRNYLKGIGKTGEGFVLLLDTASLFSDEELTISTSSSSTE